MLLSQNECHQAREEMKSELEEKLMMFMNPASAIAKITFHFGNECVNDTLF